MTKYKFKIPEQTSKGGRFKVGDTTTSKGVKSTVRDIDPQTGAVSWKIDYVPAFDSVFKEFDELRQAMNTLDQKTDDEVVDKIASEIKTLFNQYRTHIRKNYPEAYKKVGPANEEELGEMSTTSSGGATFTPGKGAQYATPYAFSKSKKKPNKATKFMYKLGYKPAPSIPNRKSKVIDYKQVMEKRNMYKYTLGKKWKN